LHVESKKFKQIWALEQVARKIQSNRVEGKNVEQLLSQAQPTRLMNVCLGIGKKKGELKPAAASYQH
jgi:hypothetical protein